MKGDRDAGKNPEGSAELEPRGACECWADTPAASAPAAGPEEGRVALGLGELLQDSFALL